jgi:hypothetical protein
MADQRRPGIGNVGSYQVAGLPHLTGALMEQGDQLQVNFPSVTKNIQIFVTGSSAIRVAFDAFTDGSVNSFGNFLTLDPLGNAASGSVSLDVKCKEIHFACPSAQSGFQMVSSLTGIEPAMMFTLSGSGINLP